MLDLVIRGGTIVDGTGKPGFSGDVGIKDGVIVDIGKITGPAQREIDATGLIVTPGWVDIHTHYDGQATWDPLLDPSFSSGVTTAIMGNCGVGFAPVRRGTEERLIELMDGVEEIPGTALHEGLRWNWSSFPEFLDVIDAQPRSFDIGALIPHGPLRLYVLGDKVGSNRCADGDERAEMVRLVDEAMQAGAFGLSSSRTSVHRTSTGAMTPDFDVDAPELMALAKSVAHHGGILEFAPSGVVGEDFDGIEREMRTYDDIVRETGVSLHLLVLQTNQYPDYWRKQIAWAEGVNASGHGRAFAHVSGRSIGALLSFFGTHPFMERPSFLEVKKLPRERWLAELAKPDVKARILTETDAPGSFTAFLNSHWHRCYDIGDEGDYEPDDSQNIDTLAARRGVSPQEAAYDVMLNTSAHPRLLLAVTNYTDGGLDRVREMLTSPAAVLGASDAGAHVMTISDGSIHSFMLQHWVRDRRRGAPLPLEQVVRMMTSDCADAIGLNDRGVIRPGLKADINIIDLDNLRLEKPTFVNDLPSGASRLMQAVTGYRATIVSGVITREHDKPTGALPGRLLRHRPRVSTGTQPQIA